VGDAVTVWVVFSDEAGFRAFHDRACADLGIPYPGENAATGETDRDAQWTTAYVDPWVDVDGTIKALVRDEDVTAYDLKPGTEPDWGDPEDLTQGAHPPEWDWHQPVPDTERLTDAEQD